VPIRRIPYIGIRYTFRGIPDSACVGSFYPTKEFRILRGISARVLDHLRVKDIFWIFLDLFDLLDLFSLSYLHRRLAYS
jgi:hypothetical protein